MRGMRREARPSDEGGAMSERAKRIEEAACLVLRWRDSAPPHGGLAAAIAALALEVGPLTGAGAVCPECSGTGETLCMPGCGERHPCSCGDGATKAECFRLCERCGGSGRVDNAHDILGWPQTCPACKGSGVGKP